MKAKINLKNIKGYLQAHYRQVLDEFDYLPSHIKEQAEFRLWRVKEKSPECYKNNICTHCGCTVDSKIYEDRACSANWCYGQMLSKEDWEFFKEKYPTYKKFLNNNVEYEVGIDDAPGIKGKKFKIKLSKEQFSGNMTPEQIQGIANEYKDYL